MDLGELSRRRWQIAAALGLLLLLGWMMASFRPGRIERRELETRITALRTERDDLARRIRDEQQQIRQGRTLPSRVVAAPTGDVSATDRLRYFLQTITAPANELELRYFSVTPYAPRVATEYEEIPFSISLTGSYAALADYLYQLEYGYDFLIRDPVFAVSGEDVRAEFELSALLLRNPSAAAPAVAPDPGRPTSLELARDPFTRPPARLATGPDGRPYFLNVPAGLRLSGIMETNGRKVAIINHEPYGLGATIDNKTITRIDERGVELSDDARSYFIEMEPPSPAARGTQEAR